MKSAAAAMIFAATAVSADNPVNNFSDYSAYTSGVYTGDNCVFSKADGTAYTLPSDKCTQTEALATILDSTTGNAAGTVTSDEGAKPTGSGQGAYTFSGSSFTPGGTYVLTGASWTTTFTGSSGNGPWATDAAESDCSSEAATTTKGGQASAPTGSWSSSGSWDAASSYGWATVSGSQPSGAASYNGTWGSGTATATPNSPSSTGVAGPNSIPINGASGPLAATGMLAAVGMFALVAL